MEPKSELNYEGIGGSYRDNALISTLTRDQLLSEFKRQVYLNSGLGYEVMREILDEQFKVFPCEHFWINAKLEINEGVSTRKKCAKCGIYK